MERQYIAIDLKSFYASVECVERGLDPLAARLVVADFSRTEKTICLAVSPALKAALGVPGRVRLYEVLQRARVRGVDFISAPPQMRKYMKVSRQIYGIYTEFVAPSDIHAYSIDEVFIDATPYLKTYKMTARELAGAMVRRVLSRTGITATAGVGTNLYLAKVAMDILAKHEVPGSDGARVAVLDARSYRERLWGHRPITDFWRVGPGYARRLKGLGIYTMGDLAQYSLVGADKLYATFGVNAELLIDHAWGWEPVTMRDIKDYRSENHSKGSGQVLAEPYDYDKARLVVWEMADALALDLYEKGLVADQLVLMIGYDAGNIGTSGAMQAGGAGASGGWTGETEIDHYGRVVPKSARGTINLGKFTALERVIVGKALELFDRLCSRELTVRRIMISAEHVLQREKAEKYNVKFLQRDLFTDYDKKAKEEERDARLMNAEIAIKKRYGKNAIMRAANYEEGATMRRRNNQVGGHKA